MTCAAVWYAFEDVTEVHDGQTTHRARMVAVACTASRLPGSPWQPARHCAAHARQLALAAEAGLSVPDPPPPEPVAEAEQARLL